MLLSTCLSSILTIFLLLNSVKLNGAVSIRSRGIIYATQNATDDGQTVVLGAVLPIHNPDTQQVATCGSIRPMSLQLVEGMVFATNMINNDSQLLPNIILAFDIRDSCISDNYALQQSVGYAQGVSNTACGVNGETLRTSGVVGAGFSSISLVVANLLGLFELPQISYSSTSPTLSSDKFRYFFRTIPSDDFQAQVLVDIIVHFKWKYIILLHSDDLYGTDGAATFKEELEIRNPSACIATQISIPRISPNYEKVAYHIHQPWISNATVVVLFGHDDDAIGMFQAIQIMQMTDASFLANITWLGSDSWSTSFPKDYYPLVKGMLGIVPTVRKNENFHNYLSSLTPTNNAQNPWFQEFWETYFNCSIEGLSARLQQCNLTNQNLDNFNLSNFVPLLIDAVYAFAYAIDALITDKCHSGTLCPAITNLGGAINGSMLREQLLNISFADLSGEGTVEFDKSGTIKGASYSIFNLQEIGDNQFEFIQAGVWSTESKLHLLATIEWTTGRTAPTSVCSIPCNLNEVSRSVRDQASCCFTCEMCLGNTVSQNDECIACKVGTRPNSNRTACSLIPLSYVMWSDPWGIGIAALACTGAIATMGVTVVFLVFCKHELIKATSRELSYILLFGILLCYTVPFLYIIMPSKITCGAQRFSIGFCFAISYSALLVKTIRIHRIFNGSTSNINRPAKLISPLSQVLFTLGLIGIQVLISVIWIVVEPPKTIIKATATSREIQCGFNPFIGVSVFLSYNFFLLILSTYYAFRTRKVPANFNEAKFINITLYTICIIWLAFVPIHFSTTSLGVLFRTVTLVMGVIFSAGTTLGCLFISKIFILFTRIKKEKKLESMRSQAVNLGNISVDNNL